MIIIDANQFEWELIPHGDLEADGTIEHWHPCIGWLERMNAQYELLVDEEPLEDDYGSVYHYRIAFLHEQQAQLFWRYWGSIPKPMDPTECLDVV